MKPGNGSPPQVADLDDRGAARGQGGEHAADHPGEMPKRDSIPETEKRKGSTLKAIDKWILNLVMYQSQGQEQ